MATQWDYLFKNLGAWQGSFTQLSPQGEVLEDTPTIVSFTGLNQNQTMRQVVQRYSSDGNEVVDEKVFEYSSLGKGILFFENGAFSQGSIQLAPYSEFGAELGLIVGNRRLRLVQLFDRTGTLDRFTLIREKLANTDPPERPSLQLEDLLGEWQGEATTIYPDWRSSDTTTMSLKLRQEGDRLTQELTFGSGASQQTIASTAQIEGSRLYFDGSNPPVQVLLLPDKASATSPLSVKVGQPLFLEVGWLVEPELRQRMIRRYDSKGAWVSLTLVIEQKVA
jgi:hypothetical protein